MASSSSCERSCLCGTVNATPTPTSLPSSCPSATHTSRSGGNTKCKICRTKPKFSFLRSQRSLELGQQGPSNGQQVSPAPSSSSSSWSTTGGGGVALSKEMEAVRGGASQLVRVTGGRRARSAERYEGLRVHERNVTAGLPRQTSLQAPLLSSISAPGDRPPDYMYPPISSPPPTYEAAMGKLSHPPSYEESLAQRMMSASSPLPRSVSPPPPWSLAATTAANTHYCSCANCKSGATTVARGGLRVTLPSSQRDSDSRVLVTENQRQLRVTLPPEPATSSHDHCPCSKCQSRYGTYCDSSGDVLLSLDTATAMQGVLTDGIALCNLM